MSAATFRRVGEIDPGTVLRCGSIVFFNCKGPGHDAATGDRECLAAEDFDALTEGRFAAPGADHEARRRAQWSTVDTPSSDWARIRPVAGTASFLTRQELDRRAKAYIEANPGTDYLFAVKHVESES